jgi:hypothetical protein
MSRESLLARGRAAAELGMTDTCTIRRKVSESTDSSGVVTPTWSTVYAGKCRLQERGGTSSGSSRSATPGESYVLMSGRILQLPVVASAGVRADDQATIDSCANDPDVVGQVFIVRDEAGKSESTARRLGVERVTS